MSFLIFFSCSDKGTNPGDGLCGITDSTSHDFSWRVDTLGLFPSALYDVAAIDEHNVWAVGVINTPEPDSIWNTEYTRNNAIKWNGSAYEHYQLTVQTYDTFAFVQELRVILAFNKNDIWFFSLGSYVHWDGINWNSAYIFEKSGAIKAAWGNNSNDFYLVGDHGSITHYYNGTFTLMESGTDKTLHDIKGYVDPKTGKTHLWVAGELLLLHYDGSSWIKVWDQDSTLLPDGYNHPGALYIENPARILVAAYYPVHIRGYCINTKDVTDFTQLFEAPVWAADMAGLAINDVFINGDANKITHFNGNSAFVYPELNFSGNGTGISYIPGNVYAVGYSSSQFGYFIHGTKN